MQETERPVIAFVVTQSLHLATMLGTCGCKPMQIKKGPELTPQGMPQVKWVYEDDRAAEEVIVYWNKAEIDSKDIPEWKDMDVPLKKIVTAYVSAFAHNLKHYIGHTKESK